MMTLDVLKAYGANTSEGMVRCMNNEPFYLRMVELALKDSNFDTLKTAMEAGNTPGAFEAAHALKGSIGNVGLTPIYEPLCELTELLQGKTAPIEDGEGLLEQVISQREKALSL